MQTGSGDDMGSIIGFLIGVTIFTVISVSFYFGSGIIIKEISKTIDMLRKKNV